MILFVTGTLPFLILMSILLFRNNKLGLSLALSGGFFFNIIGYFIAICQLFMSAGSFFLAGYNQGGIYSAAANSSRIFALALFLFPFIGTVLSFSFLIKIHRSFDKRNKELNSKELILFYLFILFSSISTVDLIHLIPFINNMYKT